MQISSPLSDTDLANAWAELYNQAHNGKELEPQSNRLAFADPGIHVPPRNPWHPHAAGNAQARPDPDRARHRAHCRGLWQRPLHGHGSGAAKAWHARASGDT